jgi:hypothetical protein
MYVCAPTSAARARIIPILVARRRRRSSTFIKQEIEMRSTLQERRGAGLGIAAGLTGALMLTACASAPPAPTAALQSAELAISNAERAEAGRYAAAELAEARTKFASADAAVHEEKMVLGEQLAEQSRTEAELASARTAATKAKIVNKEMSQSTGALVDEMKRNTGEK